MNIALRPYHDSDLEALARLMRHWGDGARYTAEQVGSRIAAMRVGSDNEVWLATDERGALLGYAQFGPVYLLGREPCYEIMQLLVDDTARGRGVGTAMLVEIEKIVRGRGFKTIRLSSRFDRVDAHRFYRKNGYAEFKSSRFFEKKL